MARKNKKREAGSGSITKRKDGRWQGQYVSGYNPETGKPRRHTIYGQTQKEVAEKLRAATSSIDNGTFQEPRKITVAEYAAEYMTTHVATLTDSTQRSYEKNLRLHIQALFLAASSLSHCISASCVTSRRRPILSVGKSSR